MRERDATVAYSILADCNFYVPFLRVFFNPPFPGTWEGCKNLDVGLKDHENKFLWPKFNSLNGNILGGRDDSFSLLLTQF